MTWYAIVVQVAALTDCGSVLIFPPNDEPTSNSMIKNPKQEENQTIRHVHTSLPYYNISTLLVNGKSVINCFFLEIAKFILLCNDAK